MYNYPGRGQPPRTTVFPTTFRRGRLAYLDPATLPPAPEDAAITGQDDQSMDSRTCSANLLARLGPSIYQPADQPATSTSPIVLATSPRPLLRGGSMADSGEHANTEGTGAGQGVREKVNRSSRGTGTRCQSRSRDPRNPMFCTVLLQA